MDTRLNIVQTMQDPQLFGPWFSGEGWSAWRVFLKALFGIALMNEEQETFRRFTGREIVTADASEGWLIVGRRGGKSLIAALVAVYLGCFRDYSQHLAPGERGTLMVIAADRRQARVVMRYINGFLESVPMLAAMIERRTRESVDLSNRVTIEVHTASFRLVRGYSIVAAICDEIAFWRSEDSANPDTAIINALRPGMASIPGSMLLCLSSPYARRGELWKTYRRHWGKNSPVLVWKAQTRAMNPSIPQSVVDEALDADPAAAAAEWLAEFRRDVEGFVSQEAVDACIIPDRRELPPVEKTRYFAFVDPSGGSRDSMTLAVAHTDKGMCVVDVVRERKPPFSPEAVVKEFTELLKRYRVSRVWGDRYAGEWPREQFQKRGVHYHTVGRNKSELYKDLLPLINSGQVELLDQPILIAQLCSLEQRTSRGGRDSIDHAPGGHDDVANAVAGVLAVKRPLHQWSAV